MFSTQGSLFGNMGTTTLTEAKATKSKAKRKVIFSKRMDEFSTVWDKPEEGETLHIISNGGFGNTECLSYICNNYKPNFISCTTWSFNDDFIDFMGDQDCEISLLVDKTIKTRKASKNAMLQHKILNNPKARIKHIDGIHAKVGLVKSGSDYFVIEASANYSKNVRIEQFAITNDKDLFYFHKQWIDEL